ncbi:TIGR04282 family arsenosugar biosynthesis glycosyltransferase [Phormidium sp. FACHB-592]|uniref:TIGR04282 family arsenosugar biosynthesis glycosyltransferase n=1 Tax=Stenomitos frigidus AS-A4 TaxID=2933935 RepID=A0ABV0KLU9_9CYAN|nr:TIGR04282 family arsenosugar biosynthesis glycosyltransferase [Phormidium sp. FACHB-592]MBD2073249.1 TIGR04282 family arsenosugar biosynthesis glycosyltransferase [Phormidium sp. FACHB-592]
MSERLIFFTRYPEPGKAKTRLIPALGAEAAAELHRQMTEHTLAQVKPLQQSRSLTVECWFAGGDRAQMQTWLGTDLVCQPQPEGDLGDRMAQAFQTAFDSGMKAAVIIGTDCPELTTALLVEAFQALQQTDLVLGPAADGGYYLIGLRRLVPDLFKTITWSTDRVFQQTVDIANNLNLSLTTLPMLTDVDRPDDLPVWERVRTADHAPQC